MISARAEKKVSHPLEKGVKREVNPSSSVKVMRKSSQEVGYNSSGVSKPPRAIYCNTCGKKSKGGILYRSGAYNICMSCSIDKFEVLRG